jgi:diguanylate cyclase (GGDEF)-like protein
VRVPVEPVVALITVAVVANLVVMALLLVPPALGRRPAIVVTESEDQAIDRRAAELSAVIGDPDAGPQTAGPGGVSPRAYDRVVRVVTWGFILTVAAIVAVTGTWDDNAPAIYLLLALAGLFVLVVHDLLPPDALGSAKFVLEGSLAVTFATLLVYLTGRHESPFFFVFPLIVAGAALVVSPRVTLILGAVASIGYIIAAAGVPGGPPLSIPIVSSIGINMIALILLAYVAVVIAREQRQAREAAFRMSTVDPLTGLFNRTFFFAALAREIERSARSGRGFCLLMMDLDELKDINDRFGHYMGDRVIRGVGDAIRNGIRKIDIAARYAGDEFVVLLPETDASGAYVLAEKVRIGVAELSVAEPPIHTSVSIGVVSYPNDGTTSDELMINADQAMYDSKRSGKNRVMGKSPATEEHRQPV